MKLETLPVWHVTQVRSKKEVIEKARKQGRTVHFATLMDLRHLEESKLEQQFQKDEGRVVLRGDAVNDNSGACEVFTKQGSSASQMTATKVLDVIARPLGRVGQASGRSIRLLPNQNARSSNTVEASKV